MFPPNWRLKLIPQDTGAVIYAFEPTGWRTIYSKPGQTRMKAKPGWRKSSCLNVIVARAVALSNQPTAVNILRRCLNESALFCKL